MKKLIILFLTFFTFQSYAEIQLESVPIKFIKNYIFIELTINNSKPLNFLFDTGAGITVVDTKIANQLSLVINSESKISTSGKSLLSKESLSNNIKIGKNTKLDTIDLILMDLQHLSDYLKTNVDGIIGYDLLKNFIIETNIDKQQMNFYEFESFIYQGDSKPLKLTKLESNLFGIEINLKPTRKSVPILLNFQIDTGANNHLSIHNKTINRYQLLNNRKRKTIKKGFGADSTLTSNIKSKVKSVAFGSKKWKNIPANFEIDPINKREKSLADGLIGQQLLLDFNIIYNLQKRIVYLEERK